MKKILIILFLLPSIAFAQEEKFPVFEVCQEKNGKGLEACFYNQVKEYFFIKFEVPKIMEKQNYKGNTSAIFQVTAEGNFRLIYINSPYSELKEEVERVFNSFPTIQPATYNNHNIEMRFTLPISFPLEIDYDEIIISDEKNTDPNPKKNKKQDLNTVVEKSQLADSTFLEVNSQLNIPFTHQRYVDYDFALHKANETHTASKPYLYSEVNKYLDLAAEKKQFLKPEKESYLARKLWNEHLLQIKKEDYWLTMDFLVDVQLGKDNSDASYTFNNTRLLTVNSGIGSKFAFSATIYESQGRFAEYMNAYISNPSQTFKPAFSEGLVPGRGKAKGFKDDAFDYPVAEGYVSYTPSKYFQFQFGNGKNFIGEGYRSFLLSDVASPSTYLKIKVDLWKFQYTNILLWGNDVRNSELINSTEHARKYVAVHYLSINITNKFNLGLFETAISSGKDGIDIGFLNPVIFYRSVEFGRGEDAGNAIVGLTAKYKASTTISLYSQLIIDEFSVGNLDNLGDWRNKFAYQLGAKYFNAFDVDNLYLQAEFNASRPYTFAHKTPILNYAHYSQPLGHLWGANFWETVAIARYKKDRWSGSAKLIYGEKGFDFIDETVSYGGNVYQSYNDRLGETGNELSQGNTAKIIQLDLQGSYLLNPSNNLSVFAGFTYRDFSSESFVNGYPNGNTTWFSVGLKADLFNWYLDF